MIVPNDTPVSPTKSQTQSDNPPSYQYAGYSTVPNPGPSRPRPPSMPSPSTPMLVKENPARPGRQACRRFTKAFVVALLIYALIASLFGLITWGGEIKDGDWQYWGDEDPEWPGYTGRSSGWKIEVNGCKNEWDDGAQHYFDANGVIKLPDMDITIPDIPDIDLSKPDSLENLPYHRHTSLSLPLDAAKHLLVGNRAYGSIQFTTGSDSTQKDIKLDVSVYYYRQYVFDKASICKLRTEDGGEGVGFYMPPHKGTYHKEDQVTFVIKVTFPISYQSVIINNFETNFSIVNHHFHDLTNKVYFRNLKLRTSNSGIRADGIDVSEMQATSSNGGISGKFHVNRTLDLRTSNGKIDVSLDLEDEGKTDKGVDVVLKSSNSAIIANARLLSQLRSDDYSPFKSDKGGKFNIEAKTSNGGLKLDLPTIPYESTVILTGRTSNANVDVELDRKGSFEGTYKADTSSYMGAPTVERADRGGRTGHGSRHLEPSFGGKGHMAGKVFWNEWDEKTKSGKVEVKTSNAKVYLSI